MYSINSRSFMTLRYPELKCAFTENNNSHKAHGNPLKNETNIFKDKVCKRSHTNKKFSQFSSKTSQELRMLSSVTLDCQVTKVVINSGSPLSEF